MSDSYKATIGIECHVQLNTATKLFAAVGNDARDAEPNTLISHICFGMPGALPVLNKKVVDYAARIAFAFHTEPQEYSYFERKHYFYPDSPAGYQITQLEKPIISGGEVRFLVDGSPTVVKLDRVQIEGDAGKNTHPAGSDVSLVDLNRAGTPLFEIVSQPDIDSPAAAKAYARELYLLVRYAGVSDADLYHGNMRFDVNVSVSKTDELGIRTETKNLNSFKSVEKAAEYEIARQIKMLEAGESIVQETRGWDDAKQVTVSQRGKEHAHDYRYFPDPDLPPVVLTREEIDAAKTSLPTMPGEWRERLSGLGLDASSIETLLEAELDCDVSFLRLVTSKLEDEEAAKQLVNLLVNIEIPLRRDETTEVRVLDEVAWTSFYEQMLSMLRDNKLSSTNAKALIMSAMTKDGLPENVEAYAQAQGLVQLSDSSELEAIVAEVLRNNPKAAAEVRAGEMKVVGFLVGQVMQASQGKANPQMVQQLIRDTLQS